jgi:hypothetical protein
MLTFVVVLLVLVVLKYSAFPACAVLLDITKLKLVVTLVIEAVVSTTADNHTIAATDCTSINALPLLIGQGDRGGILSILSSNWRGK